MSGNPADFLEVLIPLLIALGIGLGIGFIIRWIVLNAGRGGRRYSPVDSSSSSSTGNKLFGLFLEGLIDLIKLFFFIFIWLVKLFIYLIQLLISRIRKTPPPSFSSMFSVHQSHGRDDHYGEYSEGESKCDDYHV